MFAILTPQVTWAGITNCVTLTGWYNLIRLIEHFNIQPIAALKASVSGPDDPDALFIMG